MEDEPCTTSLAAVVAVVNPYKLPVTNCPITTATYSTTKRTAPTKRSQTRRHKPETPLRVSGSRSPIGLLLVGRLLDLIHTRRPSGSVQLGPQPLHAGMILLDAFSHFGPPQGHWSAPMSWKSRLVCHSRAASQAASQVAVQAASPDAYPAAALAVAKAASPAAALAAAQAARSSAALTAAQPASQAASQAASQGASLAALSAAALAASLAAARSSTVACPSANARATSIARCGRVSPGQQASNRCRTRAAQSAANSRAVRSFHASIRRTRRAWPNTCLSPWSMCSPRHSTSNSSGPSQSTSWSGVATW